jgi:Signal peptidase, peptidase S26
MPLRQGNRVFVVDCRVSPGSIKRGEWLAYEIPGDRDRGDREGGLMLSGGKGIDPVLALPGDRVRFTKEAVYVNNQPFPLAPHMPTEGEFVMPEKVWFIWPTLDIHGGARGTEAISATMERTAMVAQKQIIGRPFKRWFGRRQWP